MKLEDFLDMMNEEDFLGMMNLEDFLDMMNQEILSRHYESRNTF